MHHRGLFDLADGRLIEAAGFCSDLDIWAWCQRVLAERFACDPDDVESDDDGTLTVCGKPVAAIRSGAQVYRPCARLGDHEIYAFDAAEVP